VGAVCCVARSVSEQQNPEAGQSVSASGNEESTGENCHSFILVVNAITLYSRTIKLKYSAWGLLSVCAACTTPRLNQSYELRPPWEQHLRYVPHRFRNGYNSRLFHHLWLIRCKRYCETCANDLMGQRRKPPYPKRTPN